MSTFGQKLVEYRNHLGMSQRMLAERLGMKATNLSPIENGKRKPAVETVLRIIKTLRLNQEEAVELLNLAEYSPLVLVDEAHRSTEAQIDTTVTQANTKGRKTDQFTEPSYPPTTRAKVEDCLWGIDESYPAWYLTPDATITDVNLPTCWLWNSPLDEHTHKTDLVGENVFIVFTKPWNFDRIALPTKPYHFWWVKILIFKLMEKMLDPVIVATFKKAIFKEPLLQLIYEQDMSVDIGDGWYYYFLNIRPPLGTAQFPTKEEYLEFWVTVEVTRRSTGDIEGFAVRYQPANDQTKEIMDREVSYLVAQHHRGAFVQRLKPDRQSHFHPSFPTLTKDIFWNITSVSESFQNMLDRLADQWGVNRVKAKGMNYLELIFSLPMRKPVEALGDWEEAIPRALSSYKFMMKRNTQRHPENRSRFEATIDRLTQKLGGKFQELYQSADAYAVNYPATSPFYACEIPFLPSEDADRSKLLWLETWIWELHERYSGYLLTCVPKDDISRDILHDLSRVPLIRGEYVKATGSKEAYE